MIFERDGLTIDYELRGAGPTVILLHGLTVDRRLMIEAFEPILANAGVRRLYLDLPGHGASRGEAGRASADALVAALGGLCRQLLVTKRRAPSDAPGDAARDVAGDVSGDVSSDGKTGELEAPLIIGYSYGGYLALGLLRELGGARGLFLCCPVVEPDFARRRQSPRRIALRDAELPFSADPREKEAFAEIAVQMTRPVLERFQRVVHPANIATDQALLAAVRARYVLSRPFLDAFSGCQTPVAVVCGRDDHWAGWQDAAELAGRFPRAALHVVPDCGHLLPLEDPRALSAALGDWIARLT